eukprot:TRINITY_DN17910_c0_g1_i1.p2 TRINITY_DN17910_c0_g1~~TRINITY_DN17910_c0_g1_i1.p2  ORF type:complete len:116 (-),score=50.94 TRINITY_DN17910_c0_g1_i1:156-503(-)
MLDDLLAGLAQSLCGQGSFRRVGGRLAQSVQQFAVPGQPPIQGHSVFQSPGRPDITGQGIERDPGLLEVVPAHREEGAVAVEKEVLFLAPDFQDQVAQVVGPFDQDHLLLQLVDV